MSLKEQIELSKMTPYTPPENNDEDYDDED